jgi:osmotically-inducible protein OsmY
MRKALRGAAGALVAAGALGLARPSAAQPSPYMPPPPKPLTMAHGPVVNESVPTSSDEHVVVVSPALRKLEEMKVELAWHADLATFSYELAARINGDHVEVRGYVPNEALKEKALSIARKHTAFPVVDKLKLMPNLATRSLGRPADEVKEEAGRLLAEKLGDDARSFEVKVMGVGEVALTGTVHSVEDKLAISHLLRQVRGCGCVTNHLDVATELRNGRLITAVTRDGKETIGGKLPDLEAVVESDSFPVEGQPMLVTPAPQSMPITPAPQPMLVTPPSMGGHVPLGQPVKRTVPLKTDVKTPYAIDTALPSAAPVPSKEKTESIQQWLAPPAPAKPVPAPPSALPSSLPSTKRKPTTDNTTVAKSDVLSDPLAVPDLPPNWSKKAPSVAPKGSELAAVGHEPESKVVSAASKSEPQTAKPKSDKPASLHETTGMVLFDDEPRPAVPHTQAMPMAPAELKQRVEALCGKQARSVQVVVEPDASLRVKVTLADPQQEKALTEHILALPEMRSQRVHLETIR